MDWFRFLARRTGSFLMLRSFSMPTVGCTTIWSAMMTNQPSYSGVLGPISFAVSTIKKSLTRIRKFFDGRWCSRYLLSSQVSSKSNQRKSLLGWPASFCPHWKYLWW
jgi:hypothetical protein